MTRATVRAAVTNWLAPPNVAPPVTWLVTVFPHPPKVTTEQKWAFTFPQGLGTGAVAYVFLEDQREKRIALGGAHNGRKWRQYQCVLLCPLRSGKQTAEEADADNDTFLDSLAARLQADRTLGAPGVIFQAGEGGDHGGDDLHIKSDVPVTLNNGITQILNVVRFEIAEVLST